MANPGFRHYADFTSGGPRSGDSAVAPDVAAPGVSIRSVAVGTGSGSTVMSGTSMASPHVAGVAALAVQAHPTWSSADVASVLTTTADPLKVVGQDNTVGGVGLVDPAASGRRHGDGCRRHVPHHERSRDAADGELRLRQLVARFREGAHHHADEPRQVGRHLQGIDGGLGRLGEGEGVGVALHGDGAPGQVGEGGRHADRPRRRRRVVARGRVLVLPVRRRRGLHREVVDAARAVPAGAAR
ncbi:S8 family serine peptidase [Microbacterium elymi]|uniref:S8 family serine peptidase n=1 Tax=Microbacterium elymi TaxID=2909587 RepID=A0ABY5NMX5_9MICO|nr:S8 family serine peptidase [Microbacterium elymi]